MGKFKEILQSKYENYQNDFSKIEYLSSFIFEFNTCDKEMDLYFSKKMIEVLKSISNRTTYKYIEDKEQYINYLSMCNTPFLQEKITWGGSIRGAFFDLFKSHFFCLNQIEVKGLDVKEFMEDLIDWSEL